MSSEPHYLETKALLALIRDEEQAAEWVLEDMQPGELSTLARTCDRLALMARAERDRRIASDYTRKARGVRKK